MTVIEWPLFLEVDVNQLVAEKYQRPTDERRVNRIARDFDADLFGALVVAQVSNGSYAVIDGQHRWRVAQKLHIENVWAQMHDELTYQERALMFIQLQRQRANLTTVERFLAEIEAGDERAININRIVNEAGFVIHKNPDHPQAIRAITAVEDAYKQPPLRNGEMLVRTLDVLNAWPRVSKHRTANEIIRGLGRFFGKHPEVSAQELSAKLEELEVNPTVLRQLSREWAEEHRVAGNSTQYVLADLWRRK